MKTKIFLPFAVLALIGFTCYSGYAKSARLKEPAGPESTLLIGRVSLICTNFPKNYGANGVHKKVITIDFKDESNNFISVTSRGNDGFFHLVDPDFTHYTIVGFSIQMGDSSHTLHLGFPTKDELNIQVNSVNNLGDISWRMDFVSREETEYSRGGDSQTALRVRASIEYKANYEEVKSWFETTYPESKWKNKSWENIQVVTQR